MDGIDIPLMFEFQHVYYSYKVKMQMFKHDKFFFSNKSSTNSGALVQLVIDKIPEIWMAFEEKTIKVSILSTTEFQIKFRSDGPAFTTEPILIPKGQLGSKIQWIDGESALIDINENFMSCPAALFFDNSGCRDLFPIVLLGHELFHCGQRLRGGKIGLSFDERNSMFTMGADPSASEEWKNGMRALAKWSSEFMESPEGGQPHVKRMAETVCEGCADLWGADLVRAVRGEQAGIDALRTLVAQRRADALAISGSYDTADFLDGVLKDAVQGGKLPPRESFSEKAWRYTVDCALAHNMDRLPDLEALTGLSSKEYSAPVQPSSFLDKIKNQVRVGSSYVNNILFKQKDDSGEPSGFVARIDARRALDSKNRSPHSPSGPS